MVGRWPAVALAGVIASAIAAPVVIASSSPNTVLASAITGSVFEDVNYGGGQGRDPTTAAGATRAGARVELYNSAGAYVTFSNTNGAGSYSFNGLADGTYTVRVVNGSVSSSRTGYVAGTHLAVQTFRTDATSGAAVPVTDRVGGQNPTVADAGNGLAGATMNTTTGVFTAGIAGTAQSITTVVLAGGISGVDFGFNFDVVVNKNSAGQGSLRQFLINANGLSNAGLAQSGRQPNIDNAIFMLADGTARPGMNTGYANLFSGGIVTIALAAVLPIITDPVILDGQTQPGWSSAPILELNGGGVGGSSSGFTFSAGSSLLRGFVIDAFGGNAVVLSTAGGNLVTANYLGTNPSGSAASANAKDGVFVTSSPNNTIGGTSAAARNIISGNGTYGIEVIGATSSGNLIQGNTIGLNLAGDAALPNQAGGIAVTSSAVNTTIGGTAAGAGNVISGNSVANTHGIYFNLGGNHIVRGNRIGTNAAGTAAVPNGSSGILIKQSSNNAVGGTAPGVGNLIAYNGANGVTVTNTSPGNAIQSNAIYGNGGLGIDLADDGVTLNDGARSGTAPNNGMDSPVFTSATLSGTTLNVAGYVGSAPGQSTFSGARVEIFKADNDPTGYGEGPSFVGFLTTDASGNFSGSIPGTSLTTADKITATATDAANHSSEFGGDVFLVDAIRGVVFEDITYGGGAGRDSASAAGVGVAGARVELYNGAGALIGTTVTDASGAYAFNAVLAGNYTVRVVNGTVVSTRPGSVPGLIPVQTYRTDAASGSATAVTDHVGGEIPGKVDPGNGSTTLSALSSSTTTPQSITAIKIDASVVYGVDFGFSFDVIVNKNDAGQGTLRQFLNNANSLANSGLSQSGRTPGIEHAVFMFADGTARPGLNAGYTSMYSQGLVTIALLSALPNLIDPVVIDAQTLPTWSLTPIVEVTGSSAGSANGLVMTAAGCTIRGLAITRFGGAGIVITSGGNRVSGNYVGLGPTGSTRGNSGPGIAIQNAPNNILGGILAIDRNVVADGGADGIALVGALSTGNLIQGNWVGTTATGASAAGNTGNGISIVGGASNNNVGGTAPGAGNVVSGNRDDGIEIQDATSTGNVVEGNFVGTDVTGTLAVRNLDVGVLVENAPNTRIGGLMAGSRNVISGNATDGVRVAGGSATGTVIQGNFIGTNAAATTMLGNLVYGIRFTNDAEGTLVGDPSTAAIGGLAAGATNLVAGNAAGIGVIRGAGIGLFRNSSYGNGGLGIDLAGNGVSSNNGAKNATLPNSEMDYPVFTSQVLVGTSLSVTGYVGSAPGQAAFANSWIEVFKSDKDASGFGEGKVFLGAFATGPSGSFSSTVDVGGTGVTGGDAITATATDASGNTSEFGPNAPLLASLRGTVFEDMNYGGGAGRDLASSSGVGRPAARVELYNGAGTYVTATTTDANGKYVFTDLINDNYTVRVVNSTVSSSRPGYVSGTHLAVQTFRTNGSTGTALPVTDRVGGQNPSVSDAAFGKSGAIMNTSTGVFSSGISGTAQSIAIASVTGSEVANLDFGFSFDIIVNTANSGQGSLRQFILNANALANPGIAQTGRTPAIDHAIFMLADGTARPGLSPGYPSQFVGAIATIAPASALPTITDPVVMDARTQPGWSGTPMVEINGTNAGSNSNGLAVSAGNSTLAGFIINRFRNGIQLSGNGANTLVGNYVGTTANGANAAANLRDGVYIFGSPGNLVGGRTAADRNIISGNVWVGVEITGNAAVNNRLEGNYIGLDAAGATAIPNGNDGVDIAEGAANTTVGGTAPGAGNVISGNNHTTMDGIWINLGSGNVIQGNKLGTNAAGTAAIPNADAGVHIIASSNNTVGGTDPAAANVIAYNDSAGVIVAGNSAGNAILGNRIFSNHYLGIDLGSDGVTANDGAESPSVANLGMDFPVLAGAVNTGATVNISGYVGANRGVPDFAGSRIELFVADGDPSGYGEGAIEVGAANADANGFFSTSIPAPAVPFGARVTATATDPGGNTSEFSATVPVTGTPTADLSLAMSVDRPVAHELDYLTFTLSLTNNGPSTASGTVVQNALPPGLPYASSTASQGSYASGSGTWTVGSLAPGGVATLSLVAIVAQGASGTTVISSASADANEPDPIPASDTASVSVYVQSWGARIRTGTYLGNGLSPRVISGLGFKPDFVMIKAYANRPAVATTSTMLGYGTKELGPVSALAANVILSLNGDGFAVSSDTRVNQNNTTYSWVACEAGPGALTVGSYTGDGLSFHSVTGVGFQPDYVMVMGQAASQAVQKFASETQNRGSVFGPLSESGNWIRTIDPDGFSLGTSDDVNASGTYYFYAAWKALPNAMSVGSTVGTGVDNSPVNGAGFQPQFVIVKSKAYPQAVHRTGSMAGDATLKFTVGATFKDGVQRTLPDGWEAGLDSTVNANNATYYWAAFRDQPPPDRADLQVAIGVDKSNPDRGDTLTYSLQIQNLGPDPATGVVATDRLPSGLSYVSSTGTYDPPTGRWSVGNLASGALQTMTLRTLVSSTAAGGPLADTVQVSALDQADPIASNNQATALVTVKSADLMVSVTVDKPTPNVGDTLRYDVTVSNAGPNAAFAVSVRDRLPAGLTYRTAVATQGSFVPATGLWNVGSVSPTGSAMLTLRATVDPSATGTVVADTAAIADVLQPDPVTGNNQAIATVAVQSADLSVTLAANPGSPTVGDTLTYTVTLSNAGPNPADHVNVTDRLPAGLTYQSAVAAQGSYVPATGIWDVGSLASGANATLVLRVLVGAGAAGTTFADTAAVSAADQSDPVSGNDSAIATLTVQSADLGVSVVVNNQAPDEHSTISYTVTLNNAGPGAAGAITVHDLLPAGVTESFSSASTGSYNSGTGDWILGGLAAGTSATLNLMATVNGGTAGTTITDHAIVTATTPFDPHSANDRDSVDIHPTAAGSSGFADLQVNESVAPTSPNVGDSLIFTVTVANNGPDAATGVGLRAAAPDGVTYRSSTATAGSYASATGVWTVGGQAKGGTATLTLVTAVDANAGGTTITGVSSIAALDQADTVVTNNSHAALALVQSADLEVSVSVDQAAPHVGDTLTYTVNVKNGGPNDASGVAVTDRVPAGLTFLDAVADQGGYTAATGRWTVGNLPNGSGASLTLRAVVAPAAIGATLGDTVSVSASAQTDPVTANNIATVAVQVPSADLAVSIAADRTIANQGDLITYTVTLSNNGPDAATNVVVEDRFPNGLNYQSDLPSQGGYSRPTGIWNAGDLASGSVATLVLRAVVDAGANGITLTDLAALISADPGDPNGSNDRDSIGVALRSTDLHVSLSVDRPAAAAGDSVAFTVKLENHGPDAGTGIAVIDRLPAGLSYVAATPSQGSYQSTTGVWTVGSLGVADSATLRLSATVDSSATGLIAVADTATVTAADQGDPYLNDNLAVAALGLRSADLFLRLAAQPSRPDVGDTLRYTVTVGNAGPDSATSIVVVDRLPASVAYFAAAPSQGSYAPGTGVWNLATLAPGDSATLVLDTTVGPGAVGAVLSDTAAVTLADQVDPAPGNNLVSIATSVPGVDLAVAMTAIPALPIPGDSMAVDIVVSNLGPDTATVVRAIHAVPSQLTFSWSRATAGAYNPTSGLWSIGSMLPSASDTLHISTMVAINASGTSVVDSAFVAAKQADPVAANDVARINLTFASPATVVAGVVPQGSLTVTPAGARTEVLRIPLANHGSIDVTLDDLIVDNRATGPGTQVQLDAEWQPLSLTAVHVTAPLTPAAEPESATVASGRASWTGLGITIAAGDSVTLVIAGGASKLARDSDVLDLEVSGAAAFAFTTPVDLQSTWPLSPAGSFRVDGMTAAQIAMQDVGSYTLQSGSTGNLALSAILPANGYAADVLQKLNVVNLGSAEAGTDITRIQLWRDGDGDHHFDSAHDVAIGSLEFTGDRWEITGLSVPIPASGLQIFVTCDLTQTAREGATLRLGLPTLPDPGVGVLSDNDGPLDDAVVTSAIQTISTADRVTLTALPIAPGNVAPGARGVPLLQCHAVNGYTSDRTLISLTITRASSGGTAFQRDNEISQLSLRLDGNGDGQLGDFATDPLLGTTSFSSDRATFTGLDLTLAPAALVNVFITANISATGAADGDVIHAQIVDPSALAFAENTVVASGWPLDSGAQWTVDGMVAAQITNLGAPVKTLGRNDGPALALDVIVPPNGYLDDVLEQVKIANVGTAPSSDVAELRLWRDGGNGTFDHGAGDDHDLGAMTFAGGVWSLPVSEALTTAGARLFAAVRTAATVTDSATIQLQIPPLGLFVQSGNDGPVDAAVTNPDGLRLSDSDLLVSIDLSPVASTIGQSLTARMHVHNVGASTITSVTPTGLVYLGDGTVSILAGPTPSTMDLLAGADSTFTWTLRADAAGSAIVRAAASGTDVSSGALVVSVMATSNTHRIALQAVSLGVFSTESMPFAVNRGQTQVVPLSLTFTNPGTSEASDIRVRRLTMRLEDISGNPIVPASLISRVVISEGTTVYLDKTSLETSGSAIDFPLAQPVQIQSGGGSSRQVTLSLRIDILGSTLVPSFRVVVDNALSFTAEDAISGAPVAIQLDTGQTFALRTGVARVVTEATALLVDSIAALPRNVDRGQANIGLIDLMLTNPGPSGLGSDVRLGTLTVHVIDSTGAVVPNASRLLKHIRLQAGLQTYVDRALGAQDDSTITLAFSSLLSLPAATPTPVTITGAVADSADLGQFHLQLGDPATMDPTDANTGNSVSVTYGAPTIHGPTVTIQGRADTALVSGARQIPASVAIGSRDVPALTVMVRHPGPTTTAPLVCQSLTVRCRNQLGQPLVPSGFLSKVRVLFANNEVGAVTSIPGSGNAVTVPLSGVVLNADQTAVLEIRFDVAATAPAGALELNVQASGIAVFDDNLGTAAAVTPDGAAELPLSSGLAQLQPPARELIVSFADAMPAVLTADGGSFRAATLTLRNTAAATAGPIQLDELRILAANQDRVAVPIGSAITTVQAIVADTVWAETATLSDTATVARLVGVEPLWVDPQHPTDVGIRVITRTGGAVKSLRIGCDADGIGVHQSQSALLSVAVHAADGASFPFWTAPGNFSATTLAGSYSNFPNPFAAGRQSTTFAFYLPSPARVTIRVWTPSGDQVATPASELALGAGIHQEVQWDGRNLRGQPVYNGVYVAQLDVRSEDGTSTRLMRNIVVVR